MCMEGGVENNCCKVLLSIFSRGQKAVPQPPCARAEAAILLAGLDQGERYGP